MLIFEILFEKSGCESRIINFQEIDNLMVIMVLLYVMVFLWAVGSDLRSTFFEPWSWKSGEGINMRIGANMRKVWDLSKE